MGWLPTRAGRATFHPSVKAYPSCVRKLLPSLLTSSCPHCSLIPFTPLLAEWQRASGMFKPQSFG